jgi:hypothetical protein
VNKKQDICFTNAENSRKQSASLSSSLLLVEPLPA